MAYLLAVAGALTFAWLPEMITLAAHGGVPQAVGPYTSQVTHALDLGVVVPLAVIATVQLLRRSPTGNVLSLGMLVLNVCIGILLLAQGLAQLLADVPLTPAELVGKMLSFAALTLVAAAPLARMAAVSKSSTGIQTPVRTERSTR